MALLLLGALAAVGGVAGLVWHYGRDLPDIRAVEDYAPRQVTRLYAADGQVIASFIGDDAIMRTVISYDEIPQVMRDAMLAAEDAEFYTHPGLDFVGLMGAMYRNVRGGELRQGASTITQQVVKNLVLSPERTIRRKVQEAILAFRLEDNLSKDEILTIYLNEVFFGARYYGVEEASRFYFGHPAAELTVSEAALLAGLVQSPNRYNPYHHPERALSRRSYVLRQMWEEGMIEESQYREADASPLVLSTEPMDPWDGAFPWYVDAVRRELLESYDAEMVFGGGLHVETALDIPAQLIVEDAVRSGLRDFDARHGFHTPFETLADDRAVAAWRGDHAEDIGTLGLVPGRVYRAVILRSDDEATVMGIGDFEVTLLRTPEDRLRPDDRPWAELFPSRAVFSVEAVSAVSAAALREEPTSAALVRLQPSAQAAAVVVDPFSRHVLAVVGGYDFAESSFNRAIQARRQVGSAFKPIVYGAALAERVATPADVFLDQPVTFPLHAGELWSPRNYDGRYLGPMSMRTALARSRNVIAVRILDLVGLAPAQEFARALGVTSELTDNLTLALGSAECTPLEMANAFGTLAAQGGWAEPLLITRVVGPDGQVLEENDTALEQRVDPAVAWLTTSLMRSVVERGTGTGAQAVEHPVAGKTGTTNEARDAWFVGFTPQLAAAVWVGRDSNQTLGRGEAGGRTALPIWTDLMRRIHADREQLPFPEPPEGIVSARVDEATGLLARPGADGAVDEYFLEGTEPRQLAPDATERGVNDVLLNAGSRDGSGESGSDDWDGF